MPLDFNEIRQLLTTIAQTDITEVTLKSDDFEITIRKAVSTTPGMLTATAGTPGAVAGSGLTSFTPITTPAVSPDRHQANVDRHVEVPIAAGVHSSMTPSPLEQKKFIEVTSPMVGTFYRAPGPSEPPFVEVGDRVRSGQTVCILSLIHI
ncbi:MAG: acetyl-CoA carboxylase, biotin carboxyl carrier protein, partial [Fischerella sp.]|nr:acetyl-CoA carboxylase, biotin carboxyl carrier protein [Fischerella sp.]